MMWNIAILQRQYPAIWLTLCPCFSFLSVLFFMVPRFTFMVLNIHQVPELLIHNLMLIISIYIAPFTCLNIWLYPRQVLVSRNILFHSEHEIHLWKLLKWFYGFGLILFGLTRTYKYSMINETIGRSIITVLQSKNDVINFALLYVPLGRIFLDTIQGLMSRNYHNLKPILRHLSQQYHTCFYVTKKYIL